MVHLREIRIDPDPTAEGFPHDVPIIRDLESIVFTTPVTFLVGENGCGKSTLMEAIACSLRLAAVGSEDLERDPTLAAVRELASRFRQVWSASRTHRGFFLRAEDFFGYAKRIAEMTAEAHAEIESIDREYEGRSELAKTLAKGAHRKGIEETRRRYGDGLDAQSHGESFLKLFQTRLAPDGIYLLDEPEAPLSPLRQLALLSLMKRSVEDDRCQFVIATHSPILMAYPGARILSCDHVPIEEVGWENLEHVQLTRDFLNAPERFLRQL